MDSPYDCSFKLIANKLPMKIYVQSVSDTRDEKKSHYEKQQHDLKKSNQIHICILILELDGTQFYYLVLLSDICIALDDKMLA